MMSDLTPNSIFRGIGLSLLGLILVAAPLSAQQQQQMPPPQQQELPDSVQEMMAEFQQKQAELEEIRNQAVQASEDLQAMQMAIQDQIEEAMRAIDPEMDDIIEQLQAMEAEAQAAQQAEDMERLQALMTEAQALDGRLQQAQAQALERDDIQESLEEYQDVLMAEMLQIDPEAEQLLDEVEALADRIEEAIG